MKHTNKIGIVFCAYNVEEYVRDSLKPFLGKDNFIISAVSVPFKEYASQSFYEDKTTSILQEYFDNREICSLSIFPRFIAENEARNLALKKLKEKGVDYIWLVDGDERYKEDEIERLCEYIEKNNEYCWFKLCLRNFVFDKETYLEEPFVPPRIFRTNFLGFKNPSFCWDNDMVYSHREGLVHQNQISGTVIPKEIAWVDHYTWLNNNISKRKILYQKEHFNGICSYDWDEKKGLIFNEEFYQNREKPKLLKL